VGRAPQAGGGAVGHVGGTRVSCMTDMLMFNEIWTQDKIFIFVGTLLGLLCNLYITEVNINLKSMLLMS
jgi:hypothetical protein